MTSPELNFKNLFDGSPNPYLVLDRKFHIVAANKACLASISRGLDDILGRGAGDAFPADPATLKKLTDSLECVLRTGRSDTLAPLSFDIPKPESEGGGFERCCWSITHTPILDAAGEVEFIMQQPIDVTDPERPPGEDESAQSRSQQPWAPANSGIFSRAAMSSANRALKADSARLRRLFEMSPSPIATLSRDGLVFELANEAYYSLVGRRDLIGKPLLTALPELAGQGFEALLGEVIATGKPFVGHGVPVLLQREPAGPLVQVMHDLLCQPLFDDSGNVTGVFLHGNDVTQACQAQEALKESQERMHEGMDAARMVAWDWNLTANTSHLSDNAREILGGQWTGPDAMFEAIHRRDASQLRAAQMKATPQQPIYSKEFRFFRPDNRKMIWLEARSHMLFDGAGNACRIRGVFMDITERKQAEQELQNAIRRKDEFLAMLAHELRNPLAPITSAADLLRRGYTDEARVRQASEIISRQAKHMTGLIDDLLDVSRVTRGLVVIEKVLLDARAIVDAAVEQVRPLIQARRHHLAVHTPTDPAFVMGDQKRLVQIVVNLLNNAAKYTPEGGSIVLALEVDGAELVISVADNGIGMTPEMSERAFELFAQAERSPDRSQGGLGLGLALVKSLVELHDGQVTGRSAGRGQGSRFTVYLPLQHGKAASSGGAGDAAPQAQAKGRLKVMVVDDNVDAATMLGMLIESLGHDVVIEHSPRCALERARMEKPDICLLDIGLPDMDGNELARRLLSQPETASARLVAVTGYGQDQDRKDALAAGFTDHFVKPINIAKVIDVLNEVSRKLAAAAA